MDDSKHGVILFTFGSIINTNTTPFHMLASLKEAFAQIPQNVIWKSDSKVEGISKNVRLINWIPQRDILGDIFLVTLTYYASVNSLCKSPPSLFSSSQKYESVYYSLRHRWHIRGHIWSSASGADATVQRPKIER